MKGMENNTNGFKMIFDKSNYLFMVIGILLIMLGLYLISGGKSEDPKVFNEAIFDSRRLIYGPLVMLTGFVVEIYAIMKKTKN